MNETTAYIFIKREAPHDCVIAYEQADIDWYRISYEYIEIGLCCYNTEHKEIVYKY